MPEEDSADELVASVARAADVPISLLQALILLEQDFPDLNIWGAKPQLARRVAVLMDREAARSGVTA